MKPRHTLLPMIIGLLPAPCLATTSWTSQPPNEAIVWSFDQNCVTLKATDGKIHSVKRSGFEGVKLESRKTVVQYYPQGLAGAACTSEPSL